MRYSIFILAALIIGCNYTSRQPWPDGVIPFTVIGFNAQETADILRGMALWEMATGRAVRFVPENMSNNNTRTLWIVRTDGYFVAGGVIGAGYDPDGVNAIMLNNTDSYSVCHELGHIIGLEHEAQRPDRDAYTTITINPNVPLLCVRQFILSNPKFYDYLKYPFDYSSVMMYGEYPADGITIDGHGHDLSGDRPTWIDAWKVRDIYADNPGL